MKWKLKIGSDNVKEIPGQLLNLCNYNFSTGCLKSMEDQEAFKYSPRRGAAAFTSLPDSEPSFDHRGPRVHLTRDDVPDCRGAAGLR